MAHKLSDRGRRPINLKNRTVKEAVPEYFTSENPTLISFLEKYYQFMDTSDGTHAFDDDIQELYEARDVTENPTQLLNEMIKELGGGLPNGELFTDPRFTVRRFGDHYRNKGSRFSIEEFFRAFFQQDVEVEYPKKDIFFVGESLIGYDSQKFIQNYARYQIFSILLKVGLGVPTYEELYKKFVHPAGFYFEGIVQAEGQANLALGNMPLATVDSAQLSVIGEAIEDVVFSSSITGLIDSGGTNIRVDLSQLISTYQTLTSTQIGSYYTSLAELVDPNSFTFDDSAAVSPRMSMTTETMDNEMFTRYTSDSSF